MADEFKQMKFILILYLFSAVWLLSELLLYQFLSSYFIYDPNMAIILFIFTIPAVMIFAGLIVISGVKRLGWI